MDNSLIYIHSYLAFARGNQGAQASHPAKSLKRFGGFVLSSIFVSTHASAQWVEKDGAYFALTPLF